MAKQTINIGTTANDGTGDPLRIAFNKTNQNFTELYNAVVTATSDITNDSGFITAAALPTATSDLTNDSEFITADALPTATSDLTNDTGFITANTDYLILNQRYLFGTPVSFSNQANTSLTDTVGLGLIIARNTGAGGIYNAASEDSYDQTNRDSPLGTLWNYEGNGFGNLDTVKNRYYTTFSEALKHAIGRNIIGASLIMHDTINDKYYTFVFTHWGMQGAGTFAYTRTEILVNDNVGIEFADGTIQPTAWTGNVTKRNKVHVGPYSGHELSADESGSYVYFYDTHVILPNNLENDCPIGSFYTLIIGDTDASLRVKKYANTSTIVTIESSIEPNLNVGPFDDTDYPLLAYSIAHLTKIEQNTWSLAVSESSVAANTGDIAFDGVKILGAGTASGDGNGYSTIELVPDANFYDNDQYLIIDPTSPSHIHIRAGGTQDNSQADLFLGGENSHFRVGSGSNTSTYAVANSFIWEFGEDGGLTFPDNEVQTTAYSGGQGRMFMIDTNRTDTYTEVGNADKPFKTFAAAIAAADATGSTATFVLMGCTVTENVNFDGTAFTAITISTTCRSNIEGNISIANNSNLSQLVVRNVEIGGTFTLAGDGTTNQMNNCSFYNASFSGAVNITATNATAFYEVAFFDVVTFTNISYFYINGAQFNTDWTIIADDTGGYPVPSRGINPSTGGSVSIVFSTIANDINFVKEGTAAFVFQPHMSRLGRGGQTYTVPAGWTMTPHSSVLRGSWVNNGTTSMRNSGSDNEITGTAPSYVGTIGASIVKIDDGVHEKFQTKVDATGTVTHDCSLGHIFYHTSPDANWTANFTNLNLSNTYATAITLVIVQGGTGYYPSVLQISGAAQTINWQGNVTPTPSTNRVDVVTFSILNNSGTYTVLGQLTGF